MQNKLNYINLGCGSTYNPDWINIDITSTGKSVIAHDLKRGIPLTDASCEVVYHSHLIEHIRHADAVLFIQECFRVLKHGGVIRIATPVLEKICNIYLEKLAKSLDGDPSSADDYNWIILEMYDQTVREKPGGQMLSYLRQNLIPNESFVYSRIGEEGRNIVNKLRNHIRHMLTIDFLLKHWLVIIKTIIRKSFALYKRIISIVLLGKIASQALEIGFFRLGGEVHQWMYDRYSITKLLKSAGFEEITITTAQNSRVPKWTSFNLDTTSEGKVRKPDSMFIEALKP
jgi:predicted SAM-dependent methyltransferase